MLYGGGECGSCWVPARRYAPSEMTDYWDKENIRLSPMPALPSARSTSLPPEHPHQLHVRRPEELVDRLDLLQLEPRVGEDAGVAGEGGGVAGDGDRQRDLGAGDLGGLFGGARAGRVEHHR